MPPLPLATPPRLVLELQNTRHGSQSFDSQIEHGNVRRVRSAQFKSSPLYLTRVVLDMASVADYPVQCVNWHDRDTGLTIAGGLEQVSGAVSGGVSRWSLLKEDPQQALAEARQALQDCGGKRLMLGVGCVIMTNTPTRNIRALRSFVEQGD